MADKPTFFCHGCQKWKPIAQRHQVEAKRPCCDDCKANIEGRRGPRKTERGGGRRTIDRKQEHSHG